MKIRGETDCKVRFLFESFGNCIFSVTKNFELIKKFELREIWGYRHPAVMNIGAARKKSITSFTNKQTLVILELFREFGELRKKLKRGIPPQDRIREYESLQNSRRHFKFNDNFLMSTDTTDEAFLYSYIASAIKNPSSVLRETVLSDFSTINDGILKFANTSFLDISANVMIEVVASSHLQDELDMVLFDKTDGNSLVMEIKDGLIGGDAID